MDLDQTPQAGLDPCWSQTHSVGFCHDAAQMSNEDNVTKRMMIAL
jgi:hypothetical protein